MLKVGLVAIFYSKVIPLCKLLIPTTFALNSGRSIHDSASVLVLWRKIRFAIQHDLTNTTHLLT